MPEFLATSCDNLLKKGGGYEKLSNDAIKEMLEKVFPDIMTHYFFSRFIIISLLLALILCEPYMLQVVMLLTYVHEKDLFAKFCR